MSFVVRRLGAADVAVFRDIRLEGLRMEPASFGSTLEEDTLVSDDDWGGRLARNATFGVFDDDGLAGIAACYIETGNKISHRGHLVSVYVRPRVRGTGAAGQLIAAVIESARQKVAFSTCRSGRPTRERCGSMNAPDSPSMAGTPAAFASVAPYTKTIS